MLKRFGVPAEGLDLKIESRGVAPNGGGEVVLSVPVVQDCLKVSILIQIGLFPSFTYSEFRSSLLFSNVFFLIFHSTGSDMD